jgi:hypothetical protein
MKRLLTIMTVLVLLAIPQFTLASDLDDSKAADPHVGIWKLNLAKSKYNPPSAAPKSTTMTFTAQDNGVKCVSVGVESDGKSYQEEFAPKYDGKDYPYTGSSEVDSIAYTKIDTDTVNWVIKKAGEIIGTGQSVVSSDGKTRTVTSKWKDAKGQDASRISIFEKQE